MKIVSAMLMGLALLAAAPASAQKTSPDQAVLTAAKAVIEGKDPAVADRIEQALAPFIEQRTARVQTALDEMEAAAIDLYSSRFSADELDAIAAFQKATKP